MYYKIKQFKTEIFSLALINMTILLKLFEYGVKMVLVLFNVSTTGQGHRSEQSCQRFKFKVMRHTKITIILHFKFKISEVILTQVVKLQDFELFNITRSTLQLNIILKPT